MDKLKNEIKKIVKEKIKKEHTGNNDEHYFAIDEDDFIEAVPVLFEKEYVLSNLFCVEDFQGHGLTLFYVFMKHGHHSFVVFYFKLDENNAHSVARHYPTANWYEREIADGFGVDFIDSFDKRKLILHEFYPDGFHPLLKSVPNKSIKLKKTIHPEAEYVFNTVEGESVYQIPVGPVHAGIIEPGHFRFSAIGETVINLEIRMFYKHRGIEKLAEGKTPEQSVPIAEAISGDETVANAVCFCNAIEKIVGIKIPDRAAYLRTIYLEQERIYSLLSDLAGMVVDVAYPIGASPFFILREEILRYNEMLTGSRFMRGAICVGGVTKNIDDKLLNELREYLISFSARFKKAVKHILAKPSVIDRFETTGVISKELVSLLNLTGPIAKASSVHIDARIDHHYGIYDQLCIPNRILDKGDVLARFNIKSFDVVDFVDIILSLIKCISSEDIVKKEYHIDEHTEGYSLSVVEAARGQTLHWVYVKHGMIERFKVRTPSFCNWLAIEHAALENIVPDFPLINKSLNLSYAGTDL